ncbi:unnamed protein product [Paramecium pentaurelia]|uniref:Transmembrane protein n=1 Tax=Paramecium pentaurelia TaxID=43138 RepID=A0A8S1TQJ1_9CILI|nr:unnamed protein product [Paramecium pentaurelia]
MAMFQLSNNLINVVFQNYTVGYLELYIAFYQLQLICTRYIFISYAHMHLSICQQIYLSYQFWQGFLTQFMLKLYLNKKKCKNIKIDKILQLDQITGQLEKFYFLRLDLLYLLQDLFKIYGLQKHFYICRSAKIVRVCNQIFQNQIYCQLSQHPYQQHL